MVLLVPNVILRLASRATLPLPVVPLLVMARLAPPERMSVLLPVEASTISPPRPLLLELEMLPVRFRVPAKAPTQMAPPEVVNCPTVSAPLVACR